MTYDAGVVRAYRTITIDEIKPGMTLLDKDLGEEREVVSVSATEKADGTPKTVRIRFADGKYAGLKYSTRFEYRRSGVYDYQGSRVAVPDCSQHRFREAYDLNFNLSVQGLVKDMVDKHLAEFHASETEKKKEEERKNRRWLG